MLSFFLQAFVLETRAQLLSDDRWLVENREQLSFISLANEGIVLEIMGGWEGKGRRCTVEREHAVLNLRL